MALTNEQEFALSILDYQQEFQTKIIILCIIFAYSLWMYWYSKQIAPKNINSSEIPLKEAVLSSILKAFSLPVIVLFPLLFITMIFRGYSLNELFNLMLGFYIVVILVVFIYVFLFGWQKLGEMFGFNSLSGVNRIQLKNSFYNRRKMRRR